MQTLAPRIGGWLLGSALAALLAGCASHPEVGKSAPPGGDQEYPLALPYSIPVRTIGRGQIPPSVLPPGREVEVDLCVNVAPGGGAEARAQDGAPEAAALAGTLATWKWQVQSNISLGSGHLCWRLRLSRRADASVAAAVRFLKRPQRLRVDPPALVPLAADELDAAADATRLRYEDATVTEEQRFSSVRLLVLAPVLMVQPEARPEVGASAPGTTTLAPPAAGGAAPKLQPAFQMKSQKLGGQDPHLSEPMKRRLRGRTVQGTYQLCVAQEGRVKSVTPVAPILGADPEVMAALRTWYFKPQVISVCTMWVIQFIVA